MGAYIIEAGILMRSTRDTKTFWIAELAVTGFAGLAPNEVHWIVSGISGAAAAMTLYGIVWVALLGVAWLKPRVKKRRAYRSLWRMPSVGYGDIARDVASRVSSVGSVDVDYRWVVNALCNGGPVTQQQMEEEAMRIFVPSSPKERARIAGAVGNVFNVINQYELARARGGNPSGERVLSAEGAELLTWWRLARVQIEHGSATVNGGVNVLNVASQFFSNFMISGGTVG